MDFVDTAIVALADPATRATFFTGADLERLAGVAFDTNSMTLSGPYTAVFDEFKLGVALPSTVTAEGYYGPLTGADQNHARLVVSGLNTQPTIRVDALWRGRIVARSIPGLVPIDDVKFTWADDDIDKEIVANLGALPGEPQLETERRNRFILRVKAGLHDATAFDGARLDAWLAHMGVATVGELLKSHRGTYSLGTAQLTFPPAPAAPPAPKPLPFAGAVLVRGAGFSVAQLLSDSKVVREQLGAAGVEMPAEPWVRKRNSFVVIWVVPAASFDDMGWPGGVNAARQLRAAAWLAGQGIGLVTRA